MKPLLYRRQFTKQFKLFLLSEAAIRITAMSDYVWSLLLVPEFCCCWCLSAFFSRSLCFLAKRYIVQQKCLKKWTGSPLLGTPRYNVELFSA